MRINLPVTPVEYVLPPGAVLVSKTDTRGRITYANEDFVAASGYSLAELLGKAHNLVRHPDMPPEAFADLWRSLAAGRPWTGLVKNRRKNGDYYWVLANVTPVRRGGTVVEHMSVRSRPTPAQVAAAEAAYREFREKRAGRRRIVDGTVVTPGLRELFAGWWRLPLFTQALAAWLLAAVPALVLMVAALAGHTASPVTLGAAALAAVLGAALALLGTRRVARTLAASAQQVGELAQGDFERVFESDGDDELAVLQRQLQSLRTKVGFELVDSERRAAEATRIRQALDRASTGALVAGLDGHVIYANEVLRTLLRRHEADLRTELPAFTPDALLGMPLDALASRPADERARLQALAAPSEQERRYGRAVFRTVTSPVLDDAGRRIGTVMEWTDRTADVAVESEVQAIVAAAARGDFGRRLQLGDASGFHGALADGLNTILDGCTALLDDVQAVVASASAGDLSARVSEAGARGFHLSLATGLNAILASNAELVQRVRVAAAQVNAGAGEIARGNLDLSSRTEQAAAALQETASSMEEITATVRRNADSAGQARDFADAARRDAARGEAVIGGAVGAMTAIEESSRSIVDIIGVIDGIAFQTNLLALNAAVEAARAGEQGRGFAVVAAEVRALALRSASAAREIKTLIGATVERVRDGAQRVHDSGRVIADLQRGVDRVGAVVEEIAGASGEQARGIDEVNTAISQLDAVTQQNAALVEEAAAAAESLRQQSDELRATLARYRVGHGDARPTARAA